MAPLLYLIDGHALAYRTYFALTGAGTAPARWMTSAGEPTAGVYGFTSVLLSLLDREHPENLAVAFDTGRTFRDDLYPQYKATRAKMPEDLAPQIERIRQVVAAFRLPIFEAEGYEADDVLGTLAQQATSRGWKSIILTGDRDLLQLVTEEVIIRLAGRSLSESTDYTPQKVLEQYGVRPDQMVDFKALVGDKSDNIPGVSGVGEKTATDLLQRYGDLNSIYTHLDELPTRVRTKLEAGQENALLSKTLSAIRRDVPVELDPERCRVGGMDREQVLETFRQLEFRSLLSRLPGTAQEPRQAPLFVQEPTVRGTSTQWHLIGRLEDLDGVLRDLSSASQLAVDVETTSIDPVRARLVGIALAFREGEGFYLPVDHSGGPNLAIEAVIERMRAPLADPHLPKLGHNLKYDYAVLARAGLPLSPIAFDTMLAEWLCNPASRNLGLKELAFVRLKAEMTHIEDLIGRGAKQITMDQVPAERAAPYACADADLSLRLVKPLRDELESKGQLKLFGELEVPLIPILADMELTGVRLDSAYLQSLGESWRRDLHQLEQRVFDLVGTSFNLNSTQQLADVLFERLSLKPPDRSRKTAAGKYSTAADVLESLRGEHPAVDFILQHRELSKLLSAFVEGLIGQINPETGRVHTSYHQTGTVTGRISSSDPNLQNIPTRTEIGRRIRRAFIASPGCRLVSIDYSQIELRVAAHIAQDPGMTEAFRRGEDIHAATAAAVYNVPIGEVTADMRRHAKAVNFGLLYGQTAFGLTRATDLTLAEAEAFIQAYFERFPRIRDYLEHTKRLAAEQGYVETLLGRRRYFPELQPGSRIDVTARNRAEREAINAPVQGTAADMLKLAMIRLPAVLARAGLHGQMILQVHDELVFDVPRDEVRELADHAAREMEHALLLSVEITTESKQGDNWEEMETLRRS
ncbi:MAG: DNA polymerase I [Anaerolineales bacterium]|jgi:DNA polymerase-1